jgi:hypothetical protein
MGGAGLLFGSIVGTAIIAMMVWASRSNDAHSSPFIIPWMDMIGLWFKANSLMIAFCGLWIKKPKFTKHSSPNLNQPDSN